MMNFVRKVAAGVTAMFLSCLAWGGQRDTLLLTVDELFRMGMEMSLVLQADTLDCLMAGQSLRSARLAQAPDVEVGLTGGYLGQPVVFLHGLEDATRPESPDWSQNYSVDVTQPVYQGGRIRRVIRRVEMEHDIAGLQISADASDIRLSLMEQYLNLFCLYKEQDVMRQNISESERRLQDIIRMKEEGFITNNDVLRSELQLSNDRISLKRTENSIILASQQLDILLGLDEQLLIVPDTSALRPALLDFVHLQEPHQCHTAETECESDGQCQGPGVAAVADGGEGCMAASRRVHGTGQDTGVFRCRGCCFQSRIYSGP